MRNGRSSALRVEPEAPTAQLRCAIYTRKSTDEGLSQEFNSLDAQREAAEADIASQRGVRAMKGPAGAFERAALSATDVPRQAVKENCGSAWGRR